MNSMKITFASIPQTVEELMALPEATLDSPYKTTALAILALLQYDKNAELCYSMLDALRGPDPLNPYTKSFIKDRLRGKGYKVRSFFLGATPENNYTPTMPYTVAISETPYSYPDENWATLYVACGGADAPRPVKLRRKPSENKWYLNDLQCLSDIRTPVSQDPWA